MPSSIEQFESFLSGRNPAQTFRPNDTDFSMWGGEGSTSPNVSENAALSVTAFWSGVTLISECFGSIRAKVMRRLKGGGLEWADQHPSNYCLNKTNNGWMTPSVCKSQGQGNVLLSGNHVGEIVRNFRGQCAEIIPWLPRNTNFGVNEIHEPMYGVSAYGMGDLDVPTYLWEPRKVRESTGIEWFPYTECIHIKGFSTDGYLGKKVLDIARQCLNLGITIDQYEQRFFTQGRPSGFLTKVGGSMSLADRKLLRQEWRELHEGAKNLGMPGILSGGLDWKAMGYSNNDSQLLQSKAFQVMEIARLLHIPPHMLADLSKATETNIEHLMLEFLIYTMGPWIRKWEEELNIKLFTPKEQFIYEVKFDIDGFLRGDKESTAKYRESLLRNSQRTPDELRAEDDLPPYPDGIGSKPLIMASQLDLLSRVIEGSSSLQSKGKDAKDTETDPAKKKEPADD